MQCWQYIFINCPNLWFCYPTKNPIESHNRRNITITLSYMLFFYKYCLFTLYKVFMTQNEWKHFCTTKLKYISHFNSLGIFYFLYILFYSEKPSSVNKKLFCGYFSICIQIMVNCHWIYMQYIQNSYRVLIEGSHSIFSSFFLKEFTI